MTQWSVVCLCAQWCGVCREYRAAWDTVAARHTGMDFRWVDVEDEADLVGDLDVETFPTLLVGEGDRVRFLGPLAPHAAVLDRLLGSLTEGAGRQLDAAGQDALLHRIRAACDLAQPADPG